MLSEGLSSARGTADSHEPDTRYGGVGYFSVEAVLL